MNRSELLDYELRSSWLTWFTKWGKWPDWLQELAGRYLAWKVNRKCRRYNINRKPGTRAL